MNATANSKGASADIEDEVSAAVDAEENGVLDAPEFVPSEHDDEDYPVIPASTPEEVAAYRQEHGGSVYEAKLAVDKRHMLETVDRAEDERNIYVLAAVVRSLVERL